MSGGLPLGTRLLLFLYSTPNIVGSALALVGLCDVGANMLFSLATTRGYLSIVSVMSALYPVVTFALAAVVLHERVSATQRLGVAGALAGAAMITAG